VNTIAWLFIFVAIVMARSIVKGRSLNLTEDLGDAFQAVISGDYDALAEVINRSGDTASLSQGEVLGEGVAAALGTDAAQRLSEQQKQANNTLGYWAMKLGEAAKGYRWAAAGPDYYDCSGLMYRAAQKAGYQGPRFFTGSVAAMPGMQKLASTGMGVSQVTHGDLVVWPGHHMGVVTGNNRFYSALNPRVGMGERNINGFRKESPIYLRFVPGGK
jgi:cell wall-associated NlpC family hydrolase